RTGGAVADDLGSRRSLVSWLRGWAPLDVLGHVDDRGVPPPEKTKLEPQRVEVSRQQPRPPWHDARDDHRDATVRVLSGEQVERPGDAICYVAALRDLDELGTARDAELP